MHERRIARDGIEDSLRAYTENTAPLINNKAAAFLSELGSIAGVKQEGRERPVHKLDVQKPRIRVLRPRTCNSIFIGRSLIRAWQFD